MWIVLASRLIDYVEGLWAPGQPVPIFIGRLSFQNPQARYKTKASQSNTVRALEQGPDFFGMLFPDYHPDLSGIPGAAPQ